MASFLLLSASAMCQTGDMSAAARFWITDSPNQPLPSYLDSHGTLSVDLMPAANKFLAGEQVPLYLWGMPAKDAEGDFKTLQSLSLSMVTHGGYVDIQDDIRVETNTRFRSIQDSYLPLIDPLNPQLNLRVQTFTAQEINPDNPDQSLNRFHEPMGALQASNPPFPGMNPGTGLGPTCDDACVPTPFGPAFRLVSFSVRSLSIVGSDEKQDSLHLQIGAGGMNHMRDGALEISSLTEVIFAPPGFNNPPSGTEPASYNAGPGSVGDRNTTFIYDLPEVRFRITRELTSDFDPDLIVDGRDFLAWQRNQSLGSLVDWQKNYGRSIFKAYESAGDYNNDGVVNGRDFLAWQRKFGSVTDTSADGNGDGVINNIDLRLWHENFGRTVPVSALGATFMVPEPAGWLIAVTGIIWKWIMGRRPLHAVHRVGNKNGFRICRLTGPICDELMGKSMHSCVIAMKSTAHNLKGFQYCICNRLKVPFSVLLVAFSLALGAWVSEEVTAAVISSDWAAASSGNWGNPENWNPISVPNNGVDTYEVAVDAVGAPYTVTLDTNATIDEFVLASPNATVYNFGGTLRVHGEAQLQAGTIHLRYGTLAGGNWIQSGGTIVFDDSSILDGATLVGDLNVVAASQFDSPEVSLQNGATFTGDANISAGPTSSAKVSVEHSLKLDGSMINLGQRGVLGVSGTNTLTIGPLSQVNLVGPESYITSDLLSNGTGTVVNQGTISASGAGLFRTIEPDIFDNQELVEVIGGATLTLNIGTTWTNSGVYRVGSGSTLQLRGQFPAAFTTAALGAINNTAGGTVSIEDTLVNSGDTLVLDASTGDFTLRGDGGEIVGGTIEQHDGVRLRFVGNPRLDGATIIGDLVVEAVDPHSQIVRVRLLNGATFTGNASISSVNSPAIVSVEHALTLNGRSITLGSLGTFYVSGTNTLTFGPDTQVNMTGSGARIGSEDLFNSGTGTVVNQGMIIINSSADGTINPDVFNNQGLVDVIGGSRLSLGLNSAWTNSGEYRVGAGSTLALIGSFTTAALEALGTVDREAGSLVSIQGTLMNTGDSLVLNASIGDLTLGSGGAIVGGTIEQHDSAQLRFADSTTSRLDGATLMGDLIVNPTSGTTTVRLQNGATFTGDANISSTGSAATVSVEHALTLDNNTITLEARGIFGVGGTNTLTLGPTTQVNLTGTNARIGSDLAVSGAGTVVNQGTITVSGSATGRTINPDVFNNQGLVELTGGATLTLPIGAMWINSGDYRVGAGSTLTLSGSYSTAALGTIDNTAGGTVNIQGTLNNADVSLVLNATTGDFTLAGGVIVGGMIEEYDSARLRFANSTTSRLDGATLMGDLIVNPTSGTTTVRLQNGATFTGDANISSTGSAATVSVEHALTLEDNMITLGVNGRLGVSGTNTLTLGPAAQVNMVGANARISSDLVMSGTGTVVNQGTITVSGSAASRRIDPDVFVNQGAIEITGGAQLALGGSFANEGLINIGSGTLNVTGAFTHRDRAVLSGSGTVNIPQFINEATVSPGNSPGILTIQGNYSQTADGRLEIEIADVPVIAGVDYDRLDIMGTAMLGGLLEVPFIDGYVPAVGHELVFLTASSRSGAFDNTLFPDRLPAGVAQRVVYGATNARIQFIDPVPIDLVSDGGATGVVAWTNASAFEDEDEMPDAPTSENILSVSNQRTDGQEQFVDIVDPIVPTAGNAAHGLMVGDAADPITLRLNDTSLSVTTDTIVNANGAVEQSADSVLSSLSLDIRGGGRFEGGGKVIADVAVGMTGAGSATFAPGLDGPGSLVVDGDYTQGVGGVLKVDIASSLLGGQFDSVDVTGVATLGGTLRIDLSGLAVPNLGDTYTIATAASIDGIFNHVEVVGNSDVWVEVEYGTGVGPLSEEVAALEDGPNLVTGRVLDMGDADGNGMVDGIDAKTFAATLIDNALPGYRFSPTKTAALNFMSAFDYYTAGVPDDETLIDFDDIPGFLEDLRESQQLSAAAAFQVFETAYMEALYPSVPEPGSATLLLWCSIVGTLRQRRSLA